MPNPIVNVDLSKHPNYSRLGVYTRAEVLTLNCNSGSARVRLLDDDGAYAVKNLDIGLQWITDQTITIHQEA